MTNVTKHTDGKVGGYLVGRRHTEGGIQAVNVGSGAPLEVEADEVIITRRAVLSPQTHDFDGEELTNLEILSRINQAGGGVALLEEGGKVDAEGRCRCSGKTYHFQGEERTDRQIAVLIETAGRGQEKEASLRQLLAIQAALPFSRGGYRTWLQKMEKIASINYKSTSYG
jgi:hypothetical protein